MDISLYFRIIPKESNDMIKSNAEQISINVNVTIRTFLRSDLSTICPANIAVTIEGIASVKPINPNDSGSCVIEYICQPTMIACISIPTVTKNLDDMKYLNSFTDKDMKVPFLSDTKIKLSVE